MKRAKSRLTMCSRFFMFLTGAVLIYSQVLTAEDVYIAELMVQSNVTLEAQTLLSLLNMTNLQVTETKGHSHNVTLLKTELVAECIIVGDESTCHCSAGYIWSNEVCYNYNCCRETACKQNVSHITPLCVAKVNIHINGSVALKSGTWSSTIHSTLKTAFEALNGFQGLNATDQSLRADFEAAVSVRFDTSTLQGIVTKLENQLGAVVLVDTVGMVTIESPNTTVCYKSSPLLKCKFEEKTGSAGWNLTTMKDERFELNKGSVVRLKDDCSNEEYKSCTEVRLWRVTGTWEGIYECRFVSGSVRHTARAQLRVALLPDVIKVEIDPQAADCSSKPESVSVDITATISNSSESFEVSWSYMGGEQSKLSNKSEEKGLVYSFKVSVSCKQQKKKTEDAPYVSVTFKNTKGQKKIAKVDIPVLYAGEESCPEQKEDDDVWPKTPAGNTITFFTCAEGKVGNKSRSCKGSDWDPVISSCISKELNEVVNAADTFQTGRGATQEMAEEIFEGLKNASVSDVNDNSNDIVAGITASISVLTIMANASGNVDLNQQIFPNFIKAASNILNNTWNLAPDSTRHTMSSNYLQSVEGLVKNTNVSNGENVKDVYDSQNLELKVCSGSDCSVEVFGIDVNLNSSSGILKTVAVKNLMDNLRNNYDETPSSLLLSATLENNNDSPVEITLNFPKEYLNYSKRRCVFWNTTAEEWSDVGCITERSDDNRTICKCNHLTSFSVLMSTHDISDGVLEIITRVGLIVSTCSLLIFLIIEVLVWSAVVKTNLSHFRHTALVNIAVFLLLADCCFLASTSPKTLSPTWCLVLTVCKHLFYLAMFSWTLCMSVMLVHQLIFVFSPLRKRVFMFISSIVGYVCPILIVGCSYVYSKYTNKRYYDQKTCWLVFDSLLEGSMHAFLLPVGTVTLTNLFSMVVVIVTLLKSSVPDSGKADDKETAKSILRVVVFLTPVFGVTWLVGFAQLMLDEDGPYYRVASYSFTILNAFQGLFILITGCFAEQKVRQELFKLIMSKSQGKSESMKNLTSTTYTKDK